MVDIESLYLYVFTISFFPKFMLHKLNFSVFKVIKLKMQTRINLIK